MIKILKNKTAGLVKLIIIIIIAVAILSYYNVDIKTFVTSEQFQRNMGYIWSFIKDVWFNYLAAPAQKGWEMFIDHVWVPFIHLFKK